MDSEGLIYDDQWPNCRYLVMNVWDLTFQLRNEATDWNLLPESWSKYYISLKIIKNNEHLHQQAIRGKHQKLNCGFIQVW